MCENDKSWSLARHACYFNHSCKPNASWKIQADGCFVVRTNQGDDHLAHSRQHAFPAVCVCVCMCV